MYMKKLHLESRVHEKPNSLQVVSPDGKSHKCKKEVMRHQEKHYPENSMSKKEIELWYKVEPQLKEKGRRHFDCWKILGLMQEFKIGPSLKFLCKD